MAKGASVLDRMSARTFEHLAYDLMVGKGLVNVRWRTPGADGGRDIEGDWPVVDFSGDVQLEHWYIECKRYSKAIDWPTVHNKLPYASNHQADYLLLCTTSTLSPQCKTEVSRHNALRRRPLIRAWERPDLERFLSADRLLTAKYALGKPWRAPDSAPLLSLLWIASKATQDAYGSASLAGTVPLSLEFAAAISELAVVTAHLGFGPARDALRSFRPQRDLYEWCDTVGDAEPRQWESSAVRAFLSAVRLMTRSARLSIRFTHADGDAPILRISPFTAPASDAGRETFNAISVVCDLEWDAVDGAIIVRAREHPTRRDDDG